MPEASREDVWPVYPIYPWAHHRDEKGDKDGQKSEIYRSENLWRIISDRVLSTPLLKEENDEGNHKANEVAFAKKSLLEPQAFASLPLFDDLRFDFGVLTTNG